MKNQKMAGEMFFCVCAALLLSGLGCTSVSDDDITPARVSCGAHPPKITMAINDHLYLASTAAGTAGEIACYEIIGADSYQWYKSFDGSIWEVVSGKTKNRLQFTVESGTVYYCIGAVSADGGTAYSNKCTVECGTFATANIGKIYYSDGTVSEVYESGKTAVGVVCDVKANGDIKTIVSLDQSQKAWSTNSSGYSAAAATSLKDGSKNWKVIQAADARGSADAPAHYPAFDYCSTYNAYAGDRLKWYLPSRDELSSIYFNRTAINAALAELPEATALSLSGYYWSSSRFGTSDNYAWDIGFTYGTLNYFNKFLIYYVRPVANVLKPNV